MSEFNFNGKKYIPVKDSVWDLVAGCKKCAFYDDPELCSTVDGDKPWSEQCAHVNVHYEEVK